MGSVVRRLVVVAIATAAIAAYFVVGASAGSISQIGQSCFTSYPVEPALTGTGANLPPSCFNAGNGDISTSNVNLFDWVDLATFTSNFTSGGNFINDNSPQDVIFSNGSKEQDQSTWSLTQSSPPAKDDIDHVVSYSESVADPFDTSHPTHDFFYGAFDRASNNGDVNLDFEFNQGAATSGSNIAGAEFPVRQSGDLLITFDGNSSSGALRLGACVWIVNGSNTGWYPINESQTSPNSGDLLKGSDVCTQINSGTLPAGIGSINANTIDGSAIGFGNPLLHDEFGEVAIDLTGAIERESNPSPCINFGTGFIHTRPSESVANELKDYVAPFGLKPAGDCGVTVIKHVVNAHGGTKTASDFTMEVSGSGATGSDVSGSSVSGSDLTFPGDENGTFVPLDEGPYNVDEGTHTGYTETRSAGCSGTIVANQPATCTITNTDIAPQLTVIKHVIDNDGGTETASDFTMLVSGANVSGSNLTAQSGGVSFPGVDGAGETVTLDAGSFNVDEGDHTGYTETTSGDCSGTIALGEHKTCTITNDDIAPTLTVIKHVVDDNGGTKVASDFTMFVTGTNVSDPSFAGDESGTDVTLSANQPYTVGEGSHSGYTETLSHTGCSGSLPPGGHATCTITNDDIAPQLIVKKIVENNHGGTLGSSDFTMVISGSNVDASGVSGSGTSGSNTTIPGNASGSTVTLDQGAFDVTEGDVHGYQQVSAVGCTGTISVGQTKTCTITNADIAPQLTVVKHVINDDGGTLGSSDFTMLVSGTNIAGSGLTSQSGGVSFPGADGSGTTMTLDAGSFDVGEIAQSGYLGTLSGDCSGTIAVGDSKTCTITNDDVAATLTVIKHVVNEAGSTGKASDFTMEVSGSNVTGSNITTTSSGASFPGDESGTDVGLAAGAYSVDEGAHDGYTETLSDGCSGTLPPGGHATCTITNTRQTGTITVVKHLSPSTDPGTFDLFVDSDVVASAVGDGGSGSDVVTTGTHTVKETASLGSSTTLDEYVKSIVCTKPDGETGTTTVASTDGNDAGPLDVPVGNGDDITCTVSNRRIEAGIAVKKTGPAFAYDGDKLTYTYAVTSTGPDPVTVDTVTDDKCSPVTGPISKQNDDGDSLLDKVGADGVNPEVWTYTCTTTAPPSKIGDPPIVNTVTVTGHDQFGHPVQATDTWSTPRLHPGISIVKTGPATATAGDLVTYTLNVKDTGDTAFPATGVLLTDALCQAPPALQSKNGDSSPSTLDPGETWTYTCAVQSQPGQTLIDNIGKVQGTDVHGRVVNDQSEAKTVLNQQAVAPVRIGSAKLRGSQGCIARNRAQASVRGELIAKVTFFVDGKKVKTLTKPNAGKTTFKLVVDGRKLRFGAHRVKAVVTFQSGVTPKTKTLALTFTRCAPAKPKFTG